MVEMLKMKGPISNASKIGVIFNKNKEFYVGLKIAKHK